MHGGTIRHVPSYRISEAAALLGVSDDTIRRWISLGRLPVQHDDANRQVIDGEELAAFARRQVDIVASGRASARNRLTGIVTDVQVDGVMAKIELAAGRYRLVSLMTREAVDELGLRPGVRAAAVVKATSIIVELDTESD
jgi:molybdopterin-binding protein